MRAREFINEDKHSMPDDHKAAIRGAVTTPAGNMSTGSAYLNYRMGIALAGAPEYPTKKTNDINGDPLFSTYTDEELEIINYAAKQVGATPIKKITNNRSEELSNTYVTSPVAKPKKNRYGV
jgi:hypothetical protein